MEGQLAMQDFEVCSRRSLRLANFYYIKNAVELDVQKLDIETDCKAIVSMLNDPNKNLSAAGPAVEDIKTLLHIYIYAGTVQGYTG